MDNDKLIGIGIGLFLGWLIWRRRMGTSAGACCGGCAGLASGAGAGAGGGAFTMLPVGCPGAYSGGLGNYTQASGPVTPPGF